MIIKWQIDVDACGNSLDQKRRIRSLLGIRQMGLLGRIRYKLVLWMSKVIMGITKVDAIKEMIREFIPVQI